MEPIFKDKLILLFDGECVFCTASVQFVLKHEKKSEFYFVSLQSEVGKKILTHFELNNVESVVLIEKNEAFIKSTAALKITKYLKGAYPLLFGFMVVPSFIRNIVYDYIAKYRYKWFGKTDHCMIPSENIKKRFL